MRIAILATNGDDVVAQFSPEDVKRMLIEYTKQTKGNVGKAFDIVVEELKQKVRNM